jgi:hypothetical protein
MKHIKPIVLALALGLSLTLLSGEVIAGNASDQSSRSHSADITIAADRIYSFIDPHTKRITALLVADDRPTMTVSIDKATDTVELVASDGNVMSISIADLANAYSQGDAERRAAFLVSMQRKSDTPAHEPAPPCDRLSCDELLENDTTIRLASIVQWAVENVGNSRQITPIAEDIASTPKSRANFDPWQTASQVPFLLKSASDFWRLWR